MSYGHFRNFQQRNFFKLYNLFCCCFKCLSYVFCHYYKTCDIFSEVVPKPFQIFFTYQVLVIMYQLLFDVWKRFLFYDNHYPMCNFRRHPPKHVNLFSTSQHLDCSALRSLRLRDHVVFCL